MGKKIMTKVTFIYAEGCKDCKRMKNILLRYKDKLDINYVDCESENAVSIAIENDINDLPGCNIAGRVFQGEKFDSKEMEQFIIDL